jgi:hemerythrin
MALHEQSILALSTSDYLRIETQHNLLEKYLNDLSEACVCSNLKYISAIQSCDKEKQSSCLGRLPSFLFLITELAGRHFDNEEAIMLRRPDITKNNEYYLSHKQAHTSIMKSLQSLVDNFFSLALEDKGEVAHIYAKFHNNLMKLFEDHDRLFDDPFIQSTKTLAAQP